MNELGNEINANRDGLEIPEHATMMNDFHGIRMDQKICNALSDIRPSNGKKKMERMFLRNLFLSLFDLFVLRR